MKPSSHRAVAIVGVGAVLPDAPNASTFWKNLKAARYSISEVQPQRWDPALYYDPDPKAPDKSYSKIGGWVREYDWDPLKWKLPIPPRVSASMDLAQKWAIIACREALDDFGFPHRGLDSERTAVIFGSALGGDTHLLTSARILLPEFATELDKAPSFVELPEKIRATILAELRDRVAKHFPEITEDTMPGELANIISGRLAALFNFHGPNYTVDAACASAMAAINAAIAGLEENDFDAAITGGIDANMSATTFVKFCKIGALSATGTRPYAQGADGFVMGEGAVVFILKRLSDAERDGDKIYAVIRGLGGASDGKGKGITAPNPIGQKLAVQRAWENAGLSPFTATMVEGHGTSTIVGDVVEVQSLMEVFGKDGLSKNSIALGSVKSNFGHLKGAAGAAGVLKTALALYEKVLAPSLNFAKPNANIDFIHSPFYVNTELRPWEATRDGVRRAGVSAFGFGGTNFHAVMEEYIPGRFKGEKEKSFAVGEVNLKSSPKAPLRGASVIGANSEAALAERLRVVHQQAKDGKAPIPAPPLEANLRAPMRLAIDYGDAAELADKSGKALKALEVNQPSMWKMLRNQGVFLGKGQAPKVALLYTGQGSQYVNMLKELCKQEPIVAETFAEADRVMTPLLGKPLSAYIFVDQSNAEQVAKAEDDLRQTAITQPAVLATDVALTRLLAAYGISPDMVMGHSLGEYGALVAAGSFAFDEALKTASARGTEMTKVSMADNGLMAAVTGPLQEIERIIATIDGYVVVANLNSNTQAVIGGATEAVQKAIIALQEVGYMVQPLQVSHAFHTKIVAPASAPLGRVLQQMHLQPPSVPIVANVNGEFYPMGPNVVPEMVGILTQQIAAPVQFVNGLHTLYDAGARVFIEVGPKKALHGFVEDVLGGHNDVLALFSNHPKLGDVVSFNQALCGLYAAGLGKSVVSGQWSVVNEQKETIQIQESKMVTRENHSSATAPTRGADRYLELGHLFAEFLEKGFQIYSNGNAAAPRPEHVCITGAALGLPGTERVYDDANLEHILRGEQFIDVIPSKLRKEMIEKNITRLVKSDKGEPRFETIDSLSDAIKLAGRKNHFDLVSEFGFPEERMLALDVVTALAIGAGLEALRDAGIPLVMHYKTTSKGSKLPDRWMLPDEMRDDTGVIFASAFPGYDSYAEEMTKFYKYRNRLERLDDLESLRSRMSPSDNGALLEIDQRIHELRALLDKERYAFDRRFLLRVLAMGHSQFAEHISARGPNTQINSACASTTLAVGLAHDWIQAGRCRRVIIIAADDVTTDNLMGWFGAGFLATGAAATDEIVADAALPFDRRRHGMIIGMGGAAMVVESYSAALERGIQPICEVLSTITANSAFHGTRLDVNHICQVMERLIADAETRWGIDRRKIAPQTVFVSHETYTPARGGSASAEINALRHVFGAAADQVVIANTKGYTGHAMATGIEDVLAIKSLETSIVPPVPNFREVDPELGMLNISKGGTYPVQYALRLGAGFGSQISMSLLRWLPMPEGKRRHPSELGFQYRIVDQLAWQSWLRRVTGYDDPEIEVDHRTLRVKDQGVGKRFEQPAVQTKTMPQFALAPHAPTVTAPSAPTATPIVAKTIEKPAPTRIMTTPAPAADPVKDKVLRIVSAQTGYPLDMLDLELDLEADLGIDTVKQAEMFAAIRAEYGIPRDDMLKLRDFPTLGHAMQFVYDRRPDLKKPVAEGGGQRAEGKEQDAATAIATVSATATATASESDPVKQKVLQLISEKTGYPIDMLDLELDLEADLGIDTVKQAEVFAAIRAEYGIARDETMKLRDFPTLAHTLKFVYDRRPDLKNRAKSKEQKAKSKEQGAEGGGQRAEGKEQDAAIVTATTDSDPVKEKVLRLISEKTGYPIDMLDLELDLEADLGIDTVKQAEVFAAIRAEYGIARDDTLKLREFPTLAHTIKFVYDRRPDLKHGAGSKEQKAKSKEQREEGEEQETGIPTVAAALMSGSMAAANKIPRRVQVPHLRPALNLCKPTGVTLDSNSRVLIMADLGGVGKALAERLEKLGVQVLVIDDEPEADELVSRIKDWSAGGPIQGVYWLPALDYDAKLTELDLAGWREAIRLRVKLLYTTMRALYDQIDKPGTFLISATLLGGLHGYDEAGAVAPLGGAVGGFTKAYKRERSDVLVKVVDLEETPQAVSPADILIEETLRDPGVMEIGRQNGFRWTIGFEEQPAADGRPGLELNKDSVLLITGAAGSIVSAITSDLAAASGGTFYLLDLAPAPDPANSDIQRFSTDKENLKRDIFERLKAQGVRATPARVEKEMTVLERAHAALAAMQAVQKAGGVAHYYCVDLLDAEAVAKIIREIKEKIGRIDVLLHAAGLEISHLLPDKKPEEFDLVFEVKSEGWFNLLSAIGDMPIGAAVVFSSIAGRFGNAGQTDYSAANDFLCKCISNFRTTRPETRGIALDWTAWGGIGMAARGSIPTIMRQAGIDMLPPEAGIPIIRRELTAGGTCGEVIIAQNLGIMLNEFDETGGLDLSAGSILDGWLKNRGVVVGKVAGMGPYSGLIIETTLDPAQQPFLYDHRINGTPVLPGVMGLEALVEAAKVIFPELHVVGIEDVNFMVPFKFYRNEPRTVTVHAHFRQENEDLIAHCRLIGARVLLGQTEPEVTTHFTARVRLSVESPQPIKAEVPAPSNGNKLAASDIYRLYFHGPAYQVLENAYRAGEEVVGLLARDLPPDHDPVDRPELVTPRVIELCFQTAGLWEMGRKARMGLPYHIDRVTLLHDANGGNGGLQAVVTPEPNDTFDARVVDAEGNVFLTLQGYRTMELPEAIEAELLKPLQEAMS